MTGQLMRKWTGPDEGHVTNDTQYQFDAWGRLLTVLMIRRNASVVVLPTAEVTTYHYDAVGNIRTIEQAIGMLSIYSFDLENRLVSLNQMKDIANTTTPITATAAPTIRYTWAYGTGGRLVDEKYETSTCATNAALVTGYRVTYSFDLVGNRLALVHVGRTPATDQTTDRANDEVDRILTESYTIYVPDWEVSVKSLTTYTYKDAAASWTMPTRKRQELYDPATGEDWGMNAQTSYTYTLSGKLATSPALHRSILCN